MRLLPLPRCIPQAVSKAVISAASAALAELQPSNGQWL